MTAERPRPPATEARAPGDEPGAPVTIGAAVDVGSNSVHLLVGLLSPAELEPLRDRSVFLGLGAIVDSFEEIPKASRRHLVKTLAACREMAVRSGAYDLTVLGTEPLRRARNANEVREEILAATGLRLTVLSEHEEAELTFIGVTGGRPPPTPLIVVDIGGGSTEISVFVPGSGLAVTSVPIGSARLTAAFARSDPPSGDDVGRLRLAAAEAIQALPSPSAPAARAVFVGGTATNVARLGRLSREGMREDRRVLEALPASAVSKRFGVRPRRARQLAAGVVIIEQILDHYGLDGTDVSEASLRDGAIIAAARFGDEWPQRLKDLISH